MKNESIAIREEVREEIEKKNVALEHKVKNKMKEVEKDIRANVDQTEKKWEGTLDKRLASQNLTNAEIREKVEKKTESIMRDTCEQVKKGNSELKAHVEVIVGQVKTDVDEIK